MTLSQSTPTEQTTLTENSTVPNPICRTNKKSLQFPMPRASEKQYAAVVETGFKRFPRRKSNYINALNSKKAVGVTHFPINMDIENVSRCNLSCSLCQASGRKGKSRGPDLPFQFYKHVVDEQFGLVELKLQGNGEPTLHKDFANMIAYAADRNIWVRTTTNGTLLHRNDLYKDIIDAGVGEIQISIDGATKNVYQSIRTNADFDQVSHNCRLINDYCHSKNVDRTRMWVLLQSRNYCELDQFPRLARQLGFKRLTISMQIHGWGQDILTIKNQKHDVSHRILQEDIDRLLATAKDLGVALTFYSANQKFNADKICFWPFERLFLSSDKKIVPCCTISNPDFYSFGKYTEFDKMWNSSKYQKFRELHIKGLVPGFCRYCYEGGSSK